MRFTSLHAALPILAASLSIFPVASTKADLRADFAKAAEVDALAVAGVDGWLFLRDELRHLAKGPLTAESSPSAASAIVDYHSALADQGVQLVVMPVPAKAEIYPEKLLAGNAIDALADRQAGLLTSLRASGVIVVDLAAAFHAHRKSHPEELLYCQRDAHWSPAGIAIATAEIAKAIKDPTWLKPVPVPAALEVIQLKGDLQTTPATEALGLESISLRKPAAMATDGTGNQLAVLLGDSHTLVFSAGADKGYHCQGAGLLEHLQAQLGHPMLLVANAGGGSDAARVQLARKALPVPGFWTGRKLVVWCFSVREITEKKWKPVPVMKAK